MPFADLKSSNFYLHVRSEILYDYHGLLNEEHIIANAKQIEQLLQKRAAPKSIIRNLFLLLVETLQNMLNYSTNSKHLYGNKREVWCRFSILYNKEKNHYILESCNIVDSKQKETIQRNIQKVCSLDPKELSTLLRQKLRNKDDKHTKGAGLGFILMRRKTSMPILTQFIPYKRGTFQYIQTLVL